MSNKSLITLPILAAFVILMTSPDWMMAGLLEQQQLEPTRIQQTRLPKPDIPAVDFGNYYALVIGNSAYPRFTDLATPANDARAMAKLLTDKYRFKTEILINANRLTFLKGNQRFS